MLKHKETLENKIEEDDRAMMVYFHNERGNLERWDSWDDRKEEIRKTAPHLVRRYEKMIKNKKIFELLLASAEVIYSDTDA